MLLSLKAGYPVDARAAFTSAPVLKGAIKTLYTDIRTATPDVLT
ncbi:hypothetical protein [Sulfitobacter sp.]